MTQGPAPDAAEAGLLATMPSRASRAPGTSPPWPCGGWASRRC
ncbi:hypothetical protein QJS66_04145 [Kocuria rhizophila]|nr:hypothetical protein QJS66_04145 [Kocuria rhizophila]